MTAMAAISPGGAFAQSVESRSELGERRGSERARAGVVAAVVESDEGEDPAGGQGHVSDVRVRHDLVGGQCGEGLEGRRHDRAAFRE
nr:hypothetical protein GCM10025699_52240 [Microbacterium flavescens]